jgi:hypothetical protein
MSDAIYVLEKRYDYWMEKAKRAKNTNDTAYIIFLDNAKEILEAIRKLSSSSVYKKTDFVGMTIQDFYCNGFFGRTYDMEGSVIIGFGTDHNDEYYLRVKKLDGDIEVAHFGSRDLDMVEEYIEEWCDENAER